jgi:two-component system chemotaxis response regulator CheY
MLDKLGITNVAQAANGANALDLMASSRPHLVLSDHHMPRMTGLELLRHMRANHAFKDVRFLLITGRADQELIEEGRTAGLNGILSKPYCISQLRTAIEAMVGRL